MNRAIKFPKPFDATSAGGAHVDVAANDELDYLRYEDVEDKWPAWKTTSFILLFCGAFWTAVILTVGRLF